MNFKRVLLTVLTVSSTLLFFILGEQVEAAEINQVDSKLFINAVVPEQRIELTTDTDWDGIPNLWEIHFGFDPNSPYDADIDPDQDGLTNLQEYNYNLHPRVFDSNKGGVLDGEHIEKKTNPREKTWDKVLEVDDSDNDKLPDWWELVYDTDLTIRSEKTDPDADGLNDYLEYLYGSNPNYFDADKDKVTDGIEAVVARTSPIYKDTDNDNLSDFDEINQYGTDPLKYDSDSDGISDGDEVLNRTDPLDSTSKPFIPGLTFFYNEVELPYQEPTVKVLLDSSVTVLSDGYDIEIDIKRGDWNSTDSEVGLPNREQKVPAIIQFIQEDDVIAKKYIYFDSQVPLSVYKHGQFFTLLGLNIKADKFFYGKVGRFFKLNNIYPIGEAEIVGENLRAETNNDGLYPYVVDNQSGVLTIKKKGYTSKEIEIEKGIFNPIIRLERKYNLNWILLVFLLILIYLLYRFYKRRRNIDKKGKSS